MKSVKAQYFVALVCTIFGLMIAFQFKTIRNINIINKGPVYQDMNEQINELTNQKKDLEDSIKDLEKQIDDIEKNIAQSSDNANYLKIQLEDAKQKAGLTDVEGPGIIITINPPKTSAFNSNQIISKINASNLIMIINELNSLYAEAIMINNQRIISRSPIKDINQNIQINDYKYNTDMQPFEIQAIGNPDTLYGGLNWAYGIIEALKNEGIDIKVQKSNKIKILKYQSVIQFKYASPVEEDKK